MSSSTRFRLQSHAFLSITLLFLLVATSTPVRLGAQQPQAAQNGNHPPVSIPGPNQKIGVHPNVLAVPTLDGSKSYDPDFDVITYEWKDQAGQVIGNGRTVQVVLAYPGTYTYSLTVCDPFNACNANSTQVEVVIDLRPPAVDAPDLTVSVTDPGEAAVSKSTKLSNYVLSGATTSAVDDVDSHPQFVRVVANNVEVTGTTVFPEGDTPVSVFYSDQAGNIGTSPATIHVVDRQDNDIFVQAGVGNCFGTPCRDAILRIRGSAVQELCSLPGGSSYARYGGLIADSAGRLVSLRMADVAGSTGLELVRCNTLNAPPEPFAFIRDNGPVPAGYSEPFPSLIVENGGGLHLARLRTVVIDDNQNHGDPFIVDEDAYVFDVVSKGPVFQPGTLLPKAKLYHVKQDFWEDGPQLGPVAGTGSNPVGMYFHAGSTYVAGGGCLDRSKIPLSIHATGNAGGVSFDLNLGLFGSAGEICQYIMDDSNVPNVTNSPPCAGQAPLVGGSAFNVMAGFYNVLFDDYGGLGLTLVSNSGAAGPFGVFTNFSELPFDDPGNSANFFQNPLFSCLVEPEVRSTSMPTPSGTGSWGPSFGASGPSGLVGTNPFVFGGVVFTMAPGSSTKIATGVGYVGGVAVWPPNVSAGAALSVLIRIDSPVDVLVTDPNGKMIGMLNGVPVNDFGTDGFDSGASSHPRFYAINNPAPGNFTVQSVGTGDGPYTVHVYSIDTSKAFGHHILSSGTASPGAQSNQNFIFGAGGDITFTNHPPLANAGPNQTVDATASGNATVSLDGSLSSDPDGDALTFTWTGPFGQVNGAKPQVTLGVGAHVLTLTVDDGKGGSATATTIVTVNPKATTDTTPPVLSLPPDLTVEATMSVGAVVTFSATAADAVDGPRAVSCTPASSATFGFGATIVHCSASDLSGNTANGSFTITVHDTTPPVLTLPGTLTFEATSAAGAVAVFSTTANDRVDGSRAVACTPVSGSTFALGATTVTCSASDLSGNAANGAFTITVRDTTAPAVTAPAAVTVAATEAAGARAAASAELTAFLAGGSAADAADPAPLRLAPQAGGSTAAANTLFPIGATVVTFSFRDASGNVGSAMSTVNVGYRVCLLYDPLVAKKSGSTYPIKLRLCDTAGRSLSSPSIVLHAVSVTQASTNAPGPLDDSGNANPDFDFRYDAALAGYIFNLSTNGFSTGTYNLNFTAGSDPTVHSASFAVK